MKIPEGKTHDPNHNPQKQKNRTEHAEGEEKAVLPSPVYDYFKTKTPKNKKTGLGSRRERKNDVTQPRKYQKLKPIANI